MLTGRTRHRVQKKFWGGYTLVLQVEEYHPAQTFSEYCPHSCWSFDRVTPEYTVWRDAQSEDLDLAKGV